MHTKIDAHTHRNGQILTHTHTPTHTLSWLPVPSVCAEAGEMFARQRPSAILCVWIGMGTKGAQVRAPMCDGSCATSGPSPWHKLHHVGKSSPPWAMCCWQPHTMGRAGVEEQFMSAAVGSLGLLRKALEVLSSHTGVILR